MKFSTVAIAAALAVVASAQLDAFPKCGITCLTEDVKDTGCELTDFECSCSNKAFIEKATACIHSSCDASDQQEALTAAVVLCKSAGVDISPPTTSAPETTATPAPTSSAPKEEEEKPTSSAIVVAPSASAKPSNATTNGTITAPIETQPPTSGSSRAAAAMSIVGLGLLAAFSL